MVIVVMMKVVIVQGGKILNQREVEADEVI